MILYVKKKNVMNLNIVCSMRNFLKLIIGLALYPQSHPILSHVVAQGGGHVMPSREPRFQV